MSLKVYEATCTAPINIAVIKYWGKRDTKLNLPTNSSLSVTLSQDDLHTKTTCRVSPDLKADYLWLNGKEEIITQNKRLTNVINEMRAQRKKMEENDNSLPKISDYNLHICSNNNFPTAAGLASSAAGFACLTYTLATLYQLQLDNVQLSTIARTGSGSACRSLQGGYVAWEMGEKEDGSDSHAIQVATREHWPEMQAIILVVNDAKKKTSSTLGMQHTVATSPLIQHRIKYVVPKAMEDMKNAILNKDFDSFAEITMRDSNSFHAVCADTFPPIYYMNDISRAVVNAVHDYNAAKAALGSAQKYTVAYTFDAGPNAVLYVEKKNANNVLGVISRLFPAAVDNNIYERFTFNDKEVDEVLEKMSTPVYPQMNAFKRIIDTKVGDGPRILAKEFDENISLLKADGEPKELL